MLRCEQNRSNFSSKTSWLLFAAELDFSVSFVTSYSLQAGLLWGICSRRELICLTEDHTVITLPFRAQVNKAREDPALPRVPHGPTLDAHWRRKEGCGQQCGQVSASTAANPAKQPSLCHRHSHPKPWGYSRGQRLCSTTEQPGVTIFFFFEI